jgi:hypothetical protein
VGYILRTLKGILLWGYARNTWQYDVLCVVILAFIFLTPKSWFGQSELSYRSEHPSRFAPLTLVLKPESDGDKPDRSEIERRARLLSGRTESSVTEVRERLEDGKIVAYEVDIR